MDIVQFKFDMEMWRFDLIEFKHILLESDVPDTVNYYWISSIRLEN